MKVYRALLATVAVAFVFVACRKVEYTEPSWKVGDWASYEVTGGTLVSYTLRYAITGVDTVKGEPYYWLEMIGSRGESKFIYKMLVPYGYRGVAERMIIKVADQLIEMPQSEGLAEYPPGENRPYLYLADEINAGKIGEEKIAVPAGKFLTIHAEVKDIRHSRIGLLIGDTIIEKLVSDTTEVEVWVSDNIPVLGIVALKSPREEMKLVSTGHDATTAITEEILPAGPLEFE
ncbi:hypothetical protein CEE36_10500 [candidate division TA06 bacterium B3_TA06]|uniref:DUF3108 domain-containing protein n=1 Tax=candidate division TA06 bacterium B3_TA06 TaxID=2012487 RepID=A0A532UVN2_UNCT6|nr:MAG: hypothetical protein CEE36_10500 [candidate division TA06 bacterium B3_TA06]